MFLFVLLFFVVTVPAFAVVSVENVYMAEDVENREPINVGTVFPYSVGKIYCLTRIKGMKMPAMQAASTYPTVYHVWYRKKGTSFLEMARIPLTIKSGSWRTRSSKTLDKSYIGEWKVDVIDENNTVLKSVPFSVSNS